MDGVVAWCERASRGGSSGVIARKLVAKGYGTTSHFLCSLADQPRAFRWVLPEYPIVLGLYRLRRGNAALLWR